jgi:hypothetical protein
MTTEKMSPQRRKELRALAEVMNRQNTVPVPVTKALLECFDLIITSKDAAFLLQMGNENHTRGELAALTDLGGEAFDSPL